MWSIVELRKEEDGSKCDSGQRVPDVFSDDLPDISRERQVEFRIKLIMEVVSVTKTCTE